MKEHEVRLTATAVIWTAFTIVTVGALIFSDRLSSGMIMFLALLFTAAAVISTNMIWKRTNEPIIQIERSEKSKRRTRVDDMLDTMSDREVDELRMRLIADSDGEAVDLNELLVERERQRR